MHVLVAGATGFIGRHLVRALLAHGHHVAALVRRQDAQDHEVIVLPDWTPEAIFSALRGRTFDRVFNLAAAGVHPAQRDAGLLYQINVDCAKALIQFSIEAGVRAHVQIGSSAEYDFDTPASLHEDSPLERNRIYGKTKSEATRACAALAAEAKLPFVAARLFGTYGPGEAPHRLLPALMAKLAAGVPVPLTPGVQVRDMMHVEDAAAGMIALGEAAAQGGGATIVNLCTGVPVSVRRFSEIVAGTLGVDSSLLRFGEQAYRPDDLMHVVGDTGRLHTLTSWRPRYSVEAGIPRAIAQMQRIAESPT
jgi:nucleoside-diphosphate-sugar epimerase